MNRKLLHPTDNLLFVKHLYEFTTRAKNAKIRAEYAQRLGVTERTFNDKMNTHRTFKGEECKLVVSLYEQHLGQSVVDEEFQNFISQMSDGDRRTIDKAQDNQIKQLVEQNEEMEDSGVFLSKHL